MSLSLDKVNRRQTKARPKKKATPKTQTVGARNRPWTPPKAKPHKAPDFNFKNISLKDLNPNEANLENLQKISQELVREGQNRLERLKSQLFQERRVKIWGVELEVGRQVRVHLPAIKRRS